MDQLLTTQFDRVDKALSTLVDSIAAYNPSPQAAIDLVSADDELSHGLDQRMSISLSIVCVTRLIKAVSRHQANHARIQSLQAEADALEEQLKTSVSTLASLRHELFETPATTFPTESRRVRFDELLQYAKNIAQHTVPPTYRERKPIPPPAEKEDAALSSAAPTNGVNTPAVGTDAVGTDVFGSDAMETSKPTPEQPKEDDSPGDAPPNITAEEEEWLKKLKEDKRTWYPWPSYDKIREGNLYKLMYWQAKGKDLDTFNVEAFEEAQRNKDLPPEQEIKNPELEAANQGARVEQQRAAPRAPPRPQKIFEGFEDLDEDE